MEHSGMHIRDMQRDDIPALAEPAARTFTETFGHSYTPEELDAVLRDTRSIDYFRSAMERDTILVAFTEGRLAGYVQLGDTRMNVRGRGTGPG